MKAEIIENYVATINALPTGDCDALLRQVYAENILFKDPAHEVQGLDNLIRYFSKLYSNTLSCDFVLQQHIIEDEQASMRWVMTLAHKSLKKGAPVRVDGASFLTFDNSNKITYHQDYFDLGQMLYENVPLVGNITKFIKGKL